MLNRWKDRNRKANNGAGETSGPELPVVRFKKIRPDAARPSRGTDGSAGLDLYADDGSVLRSGDIVGLHTGIALQIPEGFCGLLMTRSSYGMRGVRIAAGCNLIDSDYRGEVIAYLRNDGDYPWTVKPGDRIAQVAIVPYLQCRLEEAEELDDTERGAGGFGSTGR